MVFQSGNSYGKHNNHWKGGRLTKEQYEKLSGLVPYAIEAWKEILLKNDTSQRWMALKATVAEKVMAKFVPDLTEQPNDVKKELDERLKSFLGRTYGYAAPKETGVSDSSVRTQA